MLLAENGRQNSIFSASYSFTYFAKYWALKADTKAELGAEWPHAFCQQMWDICQGFD